MPEAPGIPGLPDESDLSGTISRDAILSIWPQPLPTTIGPYRIIECIGEGGMGIVYKAEQREPVRRIVALKVIKLGMDTKEVVARFEAERQALALMSHPNVAKVFDAGITEAGRPYFAMEHVPGVSINSYCDTHKLTTRERLDLFIPVCHAVQHAHQKGIIHRDLKPGNILVTMFDGKPVPKVIDFGVAKATNFNLTDKTLFTHLGSVVGTIEYMSPEQATSNGLDVDTRTDVYSLGVILYQLLTGTLPFESEALRNAGAEARAKIILDTDPPKPSLRLTGSRRIAIGRRQPDSTEIAKLHRTDPRSLRKEIEGDLDWIVLKAMEKDRIRRYETANGLAMDLRRHLDDEPVFARPPNAIYQLRKFVRRHRAEVVVAAAILIGLTAMAYGIIQNRIAAGEHVVAEAAKARTSAEEATARAERSLREIKQREADESARTAERDSTLLEEVISPITPDGFRRTPVQVLDAVAQRLEPGGLTTETAIRAGARVRAVLARRYVDIGLYQRAVPQFQAALALVRRLPSGNDPDLIAALNELADALVTDGDLAGAEPLVDEAMRLEERSGFLDEIAHARTLDLRASVLAGRGDWAAAGPLYQQALKIRQKVPRDSRDLADSLTHQADVLLHQGNKDGQAMLEKAKQMYDRVFALQPIGKIGPLRRMARSAARRGDWISAEQTITMAARLAQPVDLRLMGEWIDILTARLQKNPRNLELLETRGNLYGRRGDFERAVEDFARAIEVDPNKTDAWYRYLPVLLGSKQVERYRTGRHEAIERFQRSSEARVLHQIAKDALCFPIEGEDLTAASKLASRVLQLSPPPTNNPFYYQSMGMAEYRNGHFGEAFKWLKKSQDHVYPTRDAMGDFYIAMAAARAGDQDQAHSALAAGLHLWQSSRPSPGVDDLVFFEDWILCELARDEAQKVVTSSGRPDTAPFYSR